MSVRDLINAILDADVDKVASIVLITIWAGIWATWHRNHNPR